MIAELCSTLVSAATTRRPRNASFESNALSLNDPAAWEQVLHGGTTSAAGETVTPSKALEVASVHQAVGMISGDVAMIPRHIYRRLEEDDREIDTDHPAEQLVSTQPSEYVSAFDYWRRLMAHALLWTNGYAYIERRGRLGDPVSLVNLLPDRTAPAYTDRGELFYVTEVDGKLQPLFPWEVFHLKGLSLENGVGLNLVEKARNAVGLAIAAEGYGSKFFANGCQAGGVLEVPPAMTKKAADSLEEGWKHRYTGRDNWFKTVILREGAKFHAVTIDAEKSQLKELREEQVREVARFFNLPPFKLGLQDSVSYNSTEQAQLIYLASCLAVWLAGIQGEAHVKLLTDQQRKSRSHYLDHNRSVILEIDVKTLNEVLAIQRTNEVISPNEWRRKINLRPRTDGGGDDYGNPNTKSGGGDAGQAGGGQKEPEEPDEEDDETAEALAKLVRGAAARAARRVAHDVQAMARKPAKLLAWLDSAGQDHRGVFRDYLTDAVGMVAVLTGRDPGPLLVAAEGRFFEHVLAELRPLTEPPHKAADLDTSVKAACRDLRADLPDLIWETIR